MAQPKVLRLGICACATRFHGRLEKQTMTVHDTTLRIQEMMIAEKDQRKAIHTERAHFFLDLHTESQKKVSTYLFRIELLPDGKGSERLYFGSHNNGKAWSNTWYVTSLYVPRPKRILNAMQTILTNMNMKEFKKWHARMA